MNIKILPNAFLKEWYVSSLYGHHTTLNINNLPQAAHVTETDFHEANLIFLEKINI